MGRARTALTLAAALAAPPAWAWQQAPGADALADLDPDDPASTDAALAALCARQPAAACPLGQRIAAAEWLRQHPAEAAAPDLLATFIRSRLGDLPEDPDLFERALRATAPLPLEVRQDALRTGLAPMLVDRAWARLVRRWGRALVPDEALRARLTGWPAAHPAERDALEARLRAELDESATIHGEAFFAALASDGGGLADAAVQRAEDHLLATLLRSGDPAVVEAAALLVAGGAGGGPSTLAALDDQVPGPRLPPERLAAARVQADRTLPALAPPTTPPGHRPGLEARPPDAPVASFSTVRPGPPAPGLGGWLWAALGLAAAGVVIGMRGGSEAVRAGGALMVGLALPVLAEGAARAAGVRSLAERAPLFAFYVEDDALLLPIAGAVLSPGGPVRHQAVPWPEAPGTFRVATVGASTAHGSHYLTEEIFSERVRARLQSGLPGVTVESLNLAIGGARSDGARRAGQVALAHGADALVVCLGHNEAAGFARLGRWDDAAAGRLSWQLRLSQSALYGGLSSLLPPLEARPPTLRAAEPSRAAHGRLLELAAESLRWNVGALLDEAGRAGVPVVLVVPPTNWRFVHLDPWQTPGPGDAADLEDRMARAEDAAARGDRAQARALVQSAIDRSRSPRELTSPLRATLLELAEERETTVVRADLLFDAWAPDGLTASGLFWDDIHPSAAGHRLLGDAVAAALAARLELPLPEAR